MTCNTLAGNSLGYLTLIVIINLRYKIRTISLNPAVPAVPATFNEVGVDNNNVAVLPDKISNDIDFTQGSIHILRMRL